MIFLLSQATAMFVFGELGDYFDLRYFLGFGAISAGLFFGFLYKVNDGCVFLLGIIMSLNGICQSTGWPGLMSVLGNWLGKRKQGLLLGIWAGSSSIGNILGYNLGQIIIQNMGASWRVLVLCSGVILTLVGVFIILVLKPYPERISSLKQSTQD
jgi:sugar phosphate permease